MSSEPVKSIQSKVASFIASHVFEVLTIFFFLVSTFYYVGAERERAAQEAREREAKAAAEAAP